MQLNFWRRIGGDGDTKAETAAGRVLHSALLSGSSNSVIGCATRRLFSCLDSRGAHEDEATGRETKVIAGLAVRNIFVASQVSAVWQYCPIVQWWTIQRF